MKSVSDIVVSDVVTAKEIVLTNNGHSVKIELDANGYLKINGTIYATGNVASGGQPAQ